jgi:molecular chaperone DnaK (HSP70)
MSNTQAKRQLSQGTSAAISIENLVRKEQKPEGSRDFNITLTRDKFEKLNSALVLTHKINFINTCRNIPHTLQR